MNFEEALAQPDTGERARRRPKHKHPSGWEPGVDTEKGVVTAVVDDAKAKPDWSHVLRGLGLDPDDWQVYGDHADVRVWDTPGGERCYYYKAKVTPRRTAEIDDLLELAKDIRKRGPLRAAQTPAREGEWLVVCTGDWQAGKGVREGVRRLLERLNELGAQVEQRVTTLRDAGHDITSLCLALTADLVENCHGHYEMQTFEVQLDMRQQTKLVRRALKELIDRWAPLFDKITVACCAGNHGEKRKGNKAYTSWSDNYDIEIPEQVAELLAENPERYGHVDFILPRPDDLTATVQLGEVSLGVLHGHQMKGGGNAANKADNYRALMAKNGHPMGEVDIMVSGHYHTAWFREEGRHGDQKPWTWFQVSTLDGGSPWWEQGGGAYSEPSSTSFVVGPDGWHDLELLRPSA